MKNNGFTFLKIKVLLSCMRMYLCARGVYTGLFLCLCACVYICIFACVLLSVLLMCACICLCAHVSVNAILYVCVFSFHNYAIVSYLSVENNAVDFSVTLNSG